MTLHRHFSGLLHCAAALGGVALGSGCGSAHPETPAPSALLRPAERGERPAAARPDARSLTVGLGSTGPFLTRGRENSLLIWATEGEPEGFWTLSLDASGVALGAPKRVDGVPASVGLMHVGEASRGELGVAFSTQGDEPGLWLLTLAEGGELRAPARQVADAPNEVVWLTQVSVRTGTLLFWAEHSGAAAQIFCLPLDAKGEALTRITRIHGAATAWQVQPAEYGALLGVVNAAKKVELLQVDAEAETRTVVEVTDSDGALGDLDIAASGDHWVVVFSQTRPLEPRVMSAVFDASLKPVHALDVAVPSLGGQRLLQLVSGPTNYVVWQNQVQEPGYVRVARLSSSGKTEGTPLLVPLIRAPGLAERLPEFVSHARGLDALLWSCPESANCTEPLVPTLLGYDTKLDPRSIFVSKFGERVPDLSWGLRCNGENCLALSAVLAEPPRVSVFGGGRSGTWATPTFKATPHWPEVQASSAVLATEPLADFQVLRAPQARVAIWLTAFDPNSPYVRPKTPAPDGKLAPVRSQLWTQALSVSEIPGQARVAPAGDPAVISYRARSVSGIATATRGAETLLAWTAMDNEQPQVFTTLLDARGAKLSQRMLTRKPGEVHQLTAAALDDGFAVAWLDERRGPLHVYVAKLDPRLQRKSPDLRQGNSAGSASGVALATVGKELWVARTEGNQVLLTRLNPVTLAPLGEVRVHEGDAPASPTLTLRDGAATLTWLERGAAPAVGYASLDAAGQPSGVGSLSLDDAAQSLAVQCTPTGCTAVVTTLLAGGGGELLQAALEQGGRFETIMNHSSNAPVPHELLGDELWFYSPLLASPNQPSSRSQPAIHRAVLRTSP